MVRIRRGAAAFFSLLLLVFLLGMAKAGTVFVAVPDSTQGSRAIRVGCPEMSGFFEVDDQGNSTGYACELMREISMYTGQTYTFVKTSYEDGYKQLQAGKIDLFLPVQKTEQAKKQYEFSADVFCRDNAVLLVKPNAGYYFNDFARWNEMTVGALRSSQDNSSLVQYLQKHGCSVKLKAVYSDLHALRSALENGEINAMLASSNQTLTNCKVIAQLPSSDVYIAAKKGNTALMKTFNYALRQVELNTPHFMDDLEMDYFSVGKNVMPAYTISEAKYLGLNPEVTVVVNGEFQRERELQSMQTFIDQLKQKMGIQIRLLRVDSVQAAYDKLASGEADAILPINRDVNWTKTQNMWLTQPFLSMGSYRITLAGSTAQQTAAVLKDSYQMYLCSNVKGRTLIPCDTTDQAIDLVLRGEADVTYCNRIEGDYFSSQPKYSSRLSFIMDDKGRQQYAVGISKKENAILISIFNKAIGCIPPSQIKSIFAVTYESEKMSLFDYFQLNPEILVGFSISVTAAAVLLVLFGVSNAAVKRKNKQLESAMRAKSDFLARMSHDLRTPMSAILGLAHLGSEECTEPPVKEYFSKINSSSTYLLSLINDILDMSRIENKKVQLHPEPVELEPFYQSIDTIMRPLLEEKQIRLVTDKKGAQVSCLRFDRRHMQQVLLNLLTNAVKFSNHGGRVRFTQNYVREENHMVHVCVTVQDYGIGMSEAFMQRIFHPFEQEHNRRMPEQTGTGLGLSIVKNLVEMMDGTVSVQSELGEGSTFTVDLRLPEVPHTLQGEETDTASCQLALAGQHVLLAEDHPLNAEITCRLLRSRGILPERAADGREAVERFAASPDHYYSAVLMDIRMPIMNGLEAARAIRALNRADAKTVPMLAMSANAFDEDVRESMQAGMNAHLAKPIEPRQLFEELEKWLANGSN